MSDYIKNNALPPKKKKQLQIKDLTVRISFGEPFKPKVATTGSENDQPEFSSPCWCDVSIQKFIDINILRKAQHTQIN